MRGNQRAVWLAVAVILVAGALGGIYGPRVQATVAGDSEIQDSIRDFTRVYAVIEQNYADPVDPDRAIYQGAIPGMLRTLDPHSNFFDARSFSLLREEQRGHYYGVGMTVAPRDGRTIVIAPFVGSPAYKAGLRPGDVIYRVDGKPTDGLTTSEVADMLKGPKGTVVHVDILREGHDDPLNFDITRDEIPRLSVEYHFKVAPTVGYVKLASFNENTHEELQQALDALGQDSLTGLVLDLRGNPGGLLTEGVAVADMFLAKNQLIVSHRGRSQRERRYYATRGNEGHAYPLIVLMDRFSASAAEIVAGAIQDHDRGLIVGENSFGKGLVQTVYPLSYDSGLALTTARYYTPSGRLIQRDFTAVSLYNYYYSQNRESNSQDVHTTDAGRTVYGGGGITPDVEVASADLTDFQELLVRRLVIYPYDVGVGDFVKHYLASHTDIPHDFEVTDTVLNDFRSFLTKKGIAYTEPDLQQNLDWIKLHIKKEVVTSVYGRDEGQRVALQGDPQVQKAIHLMDQAKELADKARRIIAQKQEQ